MCKEVRLTGMFRCGAIVIYMVCVLVLSVGVGKADDGGGTVAKVALGAEGGTTGDTGLPDLFTGTMSYSIPIKVPPGRNGMDPGIALTYRSSNGNGWVGMGWELELGAIQRSTRGGLDYSKDNYQLRKAGATLDLVYSATDGFYHAKMEGDFARIRQLPATDGRKYWEVTNKSGIRFLYGQTAASRQDDPADATKIFKWCLDEVVDTNGNYMSISYAKDQGQIYPDRIDYAGNGALAPGNYVKFYLDAGRSDVANMYTPNFSVKTASRLKTIEVVASGSHVRAYKLSYAQSSVTQQSLLTGVQEYGRDYILDADGTVTGGSALPVLSMGYSQETAAFGAGSSWGQLGDGQDAARYWIGDFNGDGRADVLNHRSWSVYHGLRFPTDYWDAYDVVLSLASSFDQPTNWATLSGTSNSTIFAVADFLGNGSNGFIMACYDSAAYQMNFTVVSSPGQGFTWAWTPPPPNNDVAFVDISYNDPNLGKYVVADIDGDGKADLFHIGAPGYSALSVARNTGSSFQAPYFTGGSSATLEPSTYYRQWSRYGDFNGDGKVDYVVIEGSYLYPCFSTGSPDFNTQNRLTKGNSEGFSFFVGRM